MRVEEFVDVFGLFVDAIRGDKGVSSDSFFVLQKQTIPQQGFGGLKQLNAILWEVSKSTNNKTQIATFFLKGKDEEELKTSLEKKLLLFLFDLINSKEKFEDILNK